MRDRRLLTQILVVNLLLIVAAVITTALAANPDLTLSENSAAALVLGFAIALTILVNVFLIQRRFRPLERLVDEMERADLSRPGANLGGRDSSTGPEEVERLHSSFRRMLERLEAERRRTSSAALAAQEQERARIARDLHDEVNQSLTGLLLRLEAARRNASFELAEELGETRALANRAMEELLALARQLRPTALDDLGLKAALAGHVRELGRGDEVDASFEADGDFRDLPEEVQLVVYRVAQEALANAIRHGEPEHVRVALVREGDLVELRVSDDGRGFTFDQAMSGLGLAGMRERALLVGGDLQVESRPQMGTRLSLRVPIHTDGATDHSDRDVRDNGAT
jgi:two-component system, NarL family, sensor histidine kinase UhpB